MTHEIVVIDDDPAILQLIDSLLKKSGKYSTTCFTGGAHGIEYVSKNDVRIVLVDIQMRDMFGNDVVKSLVDLHKGLNIIVITASNNYLNFKDCYAMGARDFLLKPFGKMDLLAVLDTARQNVEKWQDQLDFRRENKKKVV